MYIEVRAFINLHRMNIDNLLSEEFVKGKRLS